MHLTPVAAPDLAPIETLLDEAFGTDRFTRTAYRLREGSQPVAASSLVARGDDGVLCGSISFWPLTLVGQTDRSALLLGPIAVAGACRGRGLGAALIETGLAAARLAGHRLVMLVGDAPYYGRFGFSNALTGHWQLPGPVDQARVLALSLDGSAVPAGPFAVCGPAQLAALREPRQQAR